MEPPSLLSRFIDAVGAPVDNFRPKANQRGTTVMLNYGGTGWDPIRQIEALAEKAERTKPRGIIVFDNLVGDRPRQTLQSVIDHRHHFRELEGICLYFTSWQGIPHLTDYVAKLFEAYPGLRVMGFYVPGAEFQTLPLSEGQTIRHIGLEALIYGSISTTTTRQFVEFLSGCVFPHLQHLDLELWRSDSPTVYGFRTLMATSFPELRHLRLHESQDLDYVAAAVVESPMLRQLQSLELSWGWLSDDGAAALLGSPEIAELKKLILHHHFISSELVARLKELPVELEESPVDPENENWEEVRYQRIMRRVASGLDGELRVLLGCLPHDDLSVLDEVAIEGRVRFCHDDYDYEPHHFGEVMESPTWLQVIREANRLILANGEHDHVHLEFLHPEGEDPDLPGVERVSLCFGS